MAPRLPSLLERPITFAHRGASAQLPDNTIESFELAAKLGASGMESDVWVTADGIAVLDHDGTVGGLLRKRKIGHVQRAELPEHIPTLAEYYDALGTNLPLSLDVKDPAAFESIVATAREAGGDAEEQLWLCVPDYRQLVEWRTHTSAKLVDSTRLSRLKEGPERRADRLREVGVDAINLRHGDWSGGMIATFHRFGIVTLGWDAQQPREIANLIDIGIDGLYSDHADRMAEAIRQYFPEQ